MLSQLEEGGKVSGDALGSAQTALTLVVHRRCIISTGRTKALRAMESSPLRVGSRRLMTATP